MEEQLNQTQIRRRLAKGWLVYAFVFFAYIVGPTVALAGLYHSPAHPPPSWALAVVGLMFFYNLAVESRHIYSNFWGRHSRHAERTAWTDVLLFLWSSVMLLGPLFLMPAWPVLVRAVSACWLSAIGMQLMPHRPVLEEYDGGLVLIEPKLWSHEPSYGDAEG